MNDFDSRIEKIMAILNNVAERQEAAVKQNAEIKEQMKAEIEKMKVEIEKMKAESEKMKAESEKMKAESENIKAMRESINAMNESINGISKSNGNYAEEYFENAFAQNMTFAGIHFDEMLKRKRFINPTREDEFDIILLNKKNVAIIETKYKAREKYIDAVIKKAESFRYWYPNKKGHKIYLGLASFRFEDNIIDKAKKKGIAVIRQLGDKTVVNDENLKAY